MRRAAPLLVTTVAAALTLAPSAGAAWLSPTTLGALGGSSMPPKVAAGADGSVAAIWPAVVDGRLAYVAATRPAGGDWQPPVSVERPVSGTSATDVVVGPDGRATAVWIASSGSRYAVRTATRPAGGVWSAPHDLSDPALNAEQPALAVAPDGAVAAVWRRPIGGSWTIQARIRPAGGDWGPVADLSATGQDASSPQVALDGHGGATAVWTRSNGSRTVVQTAAKPAGEGWSAAQTLSSGSANASFPQVAVSPAGEAVAAWTLAGAVTTVQSATRAAGGDWSAAQDRSTPGRAAVEPQVGVDDAGTATVLWGELDGGAYVARTATRAAGDDWSASTPVSATGPSAIALSLAVAPDGSATAGWVRQASGSYVVQAARRTPGGSFEAPCTLSAAGRDAYYPQVAVDGRGNAVAIWDRVSDADAGRHEVQASGFDGEGPRIDALTVPSAAVAGTPVAFAAQAVDVWSPVTAVSWSFGDGATATGATATHTFAAPGERQVTATAVDALGRASSVTRTVAVTAAQTPTGGGGGGGGGAAGPARLRATVAAPRQRLAAVARRRALRVTCALSAPGRCRVTAAIPARVARALRLPLRGGARTYALGSASATIASAGSRRTLTIGLDRRERTALARARTVPLTLSATATARSGGASTAARATARLRR